jgi:hypothetical protein
VQVTKGGKVSRRSADVALQWHHGAPCLEACLKHCRMLPRHAFPLRYVTHEKIGNWSAALEGTLWTMLCDCSLTDAWMFVGTSVC